MTDPLRLNVWKLDIDAGMDKHLRYALNPKNIWNSLIAVCVSLGEVWNIEDTINRALLLVENHIDHMDEIEVAELEKLQESRK